MERLESVSRVFYHDGGGGDAYDDGDGGVVSRNSSF